MMDTSGKGAGRGLADPEANKGRRKQPWEGIRRWIFPCVSTACWCLQGLTCPLWASERGCPKQPCPEFPVPGAFRTSLPRYDLKTSCPGAMVSSNHMATSGQRPRLPRPLHVAWLEASIPWGLCAGCRRRWAAGSMCCCCGFYGEQFPISTCQFLKSIRLRFC